MQRMASESATHEALAREDALPGRSSERSFGIVVGGALLVIATWPALWGRPVRWWAALLGGALVIAALGHPPALRRLNGAWTALGAALHRVVSPLVMGAIFFGVVSPIGLVLRLAGKDSLRLRWQPDAPTYWISRTPPGPAGDTMRQQF
jgi:hypothetical protein